MRRLQQIRVLQIIFDDKVMEYEVWNNIGWVFEIKQISKEFGRNGNRFFGVSNNENNRVFVHRKLLISYETFLRKERDFV